MAHHQDPAIDSLFAEIWSILKANEEALENGTPFDTEGLEEKTQEVCERVTSLPRGEAVEYEAELTKMVTFLNKITEAMQEQRSGFLDEFQSLNQRQNAMRAYSRASTLSPSSKKDEPKN